MVIYFLKNKRGNNIIQEDRFIYHSHKKLSTENKQLSVDAGSEGSAPMAAF
jgi:hypothetical protein